MVFHNPLLAVLNSKNKQKTIGFLLKHEALMSEREIASVLGVSHMSVNRIMRELAEMNLVHVLRAGRSYLWRVNRNSYVFQALSGIFQTLSGSREPLQDLKETILANLPLSLINKITLFGSVARGREQFNSDIDLYIQVEDENGKREIEPAISKLGLLCVERYGNPLSAYVLTEKEWKERRKVKLMANIKEGINLFPLANTHESQV